MKSLLWVDDNIEQFQPFVTKFQEHGLYVGTASSSPNGFIELRKQQYDIVFWDFMMGHEPCVHILDSIVEMAGSAQVFIVSSFLYLNEVMEQLTRKISKSSLRIATIDKTTLPFTDDDQAIQDFLSDLMSGQYFASPSKAEDVDRRVQEAMRSSEVLLWNSYLELDLSGKMAALDKVAEITKDIRQQLEQEGYVYMLFCGNYSEPLQKCKSLDEIPSEKQIVDIARSLDSAPFEFSVSGMVDDLSANCCERSGLKGYPILKIGYKRESEEIHFDTGNPFTLISFEWYTEKGWIDPSVLIQHHKAGDMAFKGRHIEWHNVIVTDSNGVTACCTFKGFAACDWNAYRIAIECGPDCKNDYRSSSKSKLCKYRTGLLGRNFATNLQKKLTIDCMTGNITFR